jgi:histidinol phosphatase-like PHP family hydrolase
MLIDMHAHSSGISRCCRIPYDEVIRRALDVGLDGIVLTNHYQKNYVLDGDAAAFAKKYTDEFRSAKAYGDAVGCKVFFGAEVTMEQHGGAHLLLYGIDERFIEETPTVFELSQEGLYRMVKAAV